MGKFFWKKAARRYSDFVNNHGFSVITIICIAVITATAVWTNRDHSIPYAAPTPPVLQDVSAAQLMQESLDSASTPVHTQTPAPPEWSRPLDVMIVLRDFDDQQLHYSQDTGIWQVHDGIDLKTEPGDKIYAMGSGVVGMIDDSETGCISVTVEHADGYAVVYKGLTALSAIRSGDRVHAGQTLGFAGSAAPCESALGSHLHLTVQRHSVSVDPLLLIDTNDE